MKKKLFLLLWSVMIINLINAQNANCQFFGQKNNDLSNLKRVIAEVQKAPDNLKAHQRYIQVMGVNNPLIIKQYQIWLKRFPRSVIVPFAIGKAYQEQNDPECIKYLEKAASIDSNFSETWVALSAYASNNNNNFDAIQYMRKATKIDLKNANFAYRFASLHKELEPVKYDSLMIDLIHRFPDKENSMKALYFLASYPFNKNEKLFYYEQLYDAGIGRQSGWFWFGMKEYYDYLINQDPDKAFELALKMVLKVKDNRLAWKQKLSIARGFIEARKLLQDDKPANALSTLNSINLGNNPSMGIQVDAEELLALYKAEAADANKQTKLALDSLALFYSKQPSDKIYSRLKTLGTKIKLDSVAISAYVWKLRDSAAWKEQTNFTLENYKDGKKVSLSDYRGKVVLLTFWFPSCLPCREEFPHFESVVKKINNSNLAYIAINDGNSQENMVLPLVKAKGYTFLPLRDSPNEKKGNLPYVSSAPTNYLIDQKGRVIFSDFQINDNNERMLELMIRELLATGS